MEQTGFPTTKVIQLPQRQHYTPLPKGYLSYVAHLGDDLTPLEAARMSTGNPSGIDEAHDDGTRNYLWRNEHATPFEMAVLQVEVMAPIATAREWMRHRTQSYNEFSLRYSEAIEVFYEPEKARMLGPDPNNKQGSLVALPPMAQEEAVKIIAENDQEAWRRYRRLLELGLSNEVARYVLPVNLYTKFRAQANLRNWLHFLHLRLDSKAQYEIRVYAQAVADLVYQLWPKTWAVFEEHTLYAIKLSRTEKYALGALLEQPGIRAHFEAALLSSGVKLKRVNEIIAAIGIV